MCPTDRPPAKSIFSKIFSNRRARIQALTHTCTHMHANTRMHFIEEISDLKQKPTRNITLIRWFSTWISKLPSLAKAPPQTWLRLILALFFISQTAPHTPPTNQTTHLLKFSAKAQLYKKIKFRRQCQHKLAVSVQAS